MSNENFNDVPDFIKRECELRGISLTQFFEAQYILCEYVDKIRKAFIVGYLKDL